MAYFLSPIVNDQQCDSNGAPLAGGLVYTYLAGSSTPAPTYTDNTGITPQANPIVMNTLGAVQSPVWLTSGTAYKFIIRDALGVLQRTIDNVSGINDASISVSQWISGATPTYISATSFSVAGDQTGSFQVGRRVQCTVTAGVVYGTITASVYTTLTTVTVSLDSGALDAGLIAVSIGLLTATSPSMPYGIFMRLAGSETVTGDKTLSGNNTYSGSGTYSGSNSYSGASTFSGNIIMSGAPVLFAGVSVAAAATSMNIWVANFISVTGSPTTITAFANAPQIGCETELYMNAAHTFVHSANLLMPGSSNYTTTIGDRIRVRALSTTVFVAEIFFKISQPIGLNQSYQDMTASRASGTTYTNSTGRAIFVSAWGTTGGTTNQTAACYVNGVLIENNSWYANGAGYSANAFFIVPPGATYSITFTNVSSITKWFELR